MVVDFRFKYLTPLFFLPHLNCRLLFLWKAAREFKEGKKETKILFNSIFILGFYDHSVGAEIFPETCRNCNVSKTRC